MPKTFDKPLLILDLDETLIYATTVERPTPYDFRAGPYLVYKRPFLDEFIATVLRGFELAVWSSSSSDYVSVITQQLFSQLVPLQFQWSRTKCTQRYHSEWYETYWIKDLKKVKRLGYRLSQVLIVDDTPRKVERNFGNAVYVSSFEGNPEDMELTMLGPYLLSLTKHDDFRRIEKRHWRTAK